MRHLTAALALVLSLGAVDVACPHEGRAQEDFRAADLDRPIRVEDAQPVKHREWELEAGGRGSWSGRGDEAAGTLELKTGVLLNTQAGLTLEAGWGEDDGRGLAGGAAHLLYNFRRETWSWPALSARVDVETPGTGGVGRDRWGWSLVGIATRSLDRLRLHANAGYAEGDERSWRAGVAFDYPLGLFSRAVLGDLYAEIPTGSEGARVWAGLGTRWQLTNRSVLDLGAGTRLDAWGDGEANVELVVGLSRAFGVVALTPVPPYPDPRLD